MGCLCNETQGINFLIIFISFGCYAKILRPDIVFFLVIFITQY